MLFLPENFAFLGTASKQSLAMAEPIQGPLVHRFCALAEKHKIWLALGGFQEKVAGMDSKIHDTHIVVNAAGEVVSTYRKIHMFGAYSENTKEK